MFRRQRKVMEKQAASLRGHRGDIDQESLMMIDTIISLEKQLEAAKMDRIKASEEEKESHTQLGLIKRRNQGLINDTISKRDKIRIQKNVTCREMAALKDQVEKERQEKIDDLQKSHNDELESMQAEFEKMQQQILEEFEADKLKLQHKLGLKYKKQEDRFNQLDSRVKNLEQEKYAEALKAREDQIKEEYTQIEEQLEYDNHIQILILEDKTEKYRVEIAKKAKVNDLLQNKIRRNQEHIAELKDEEAELDLKSAEVTAAITAKREKLDRMDKRMVNGMKLLKDLKKEWSEIDKDISDAGLKLSERSKKFKSMKETIAELENFKRNTQAKRSEALLAPVSLKKPIDLEKQQRLIQQEREEEIKTQKSFLILSDLMKQRGDIGRELINDEKRKVRNIEERMVSSHFLFKEEFDKSLPPDFLKENPCTPKKQEERIGNSSVQMARKQVQEKVLKKTPIVRKKVLEKTPVSEVKGVKKPPVQATVFKKVQPHCGLPPVDI